MTATASYTVTASKLVRQHCATLTITVKDAARRSGYTTGTAVYTVGTPSAEQPDHTAAR